MGRVLHRFSWDITSSHACPIEFVNLHHVIKSDNLQFNTLGRWDDRLIDQASDASIYETIDPATQDIILNIVRFIYDVKFYRNIVR